MPWALFVLFYKMHVSGPKKFVFQALFNFVKAFATQSYSGKIKWHLYYINQVVNMKQLKERDI